MALSILDGNQSATTLSTIVTSGQHIPAHTVVSLGTQAIANITSAISGTSVCVGSISISGTPSVTGSVSVLNFPASQAVTFGQAIVSASNITGLNNSVGTDGGTPAATNFIKIGGHQDGANSVEHIVHVSAGGAMKVDASDSTVTFGTIIGTVTIGNSVTISSLPAISGTVTANLGNASNVIGGGYSSLYNLFASETVSVIQSGTVVVDSINNPISGTVTIGSALPAGTNRIGVVTIGAGTVTIGAGTAQIGSVTASGTVTANVVSSSLLLSGLLNEANVVAYASRGVAIGFNENQISGEFKIPNTDGSFPFPVALVLNDNAGYAYGVGNDANSQKLPISGTVTANTFALQGTAVTTSNFTSTTASTVLAGYNATREVLTIFNEGAGNLHICVGATCTTIAYQVRLSAGDYYEVPNHQTTITHSAVFATAGTARVTEVS